MNSNIFVSGVYLWLMVSSLVMAFLYYFDPGLPPGMIGLKDLPLYLILILGFVYTNYSNYKVALPRVLFFLFFYLLLAFVLSPADLFVKFASIRQLISFFVLVAVGAMLSSGKSSIISFSRYIVTLGIFLGLFGLLDFFFQFMGGGLLEPFFAVKNIGVFDTGYPYFFTEPIPEIFQDFLGVIEIPRFASSVLDPINAGHVIVFLIFIVFVDPVVVPDRLQRYITIGFLSICAFLTFSKGSWLQLVLSLVFYFGRGYENLLKFFTIFVFVSLVFIAEFVPGVAVHLQGTLSAFDSLSLFGHGLGMVGNYSAMFGDSLDLGIGDSFLGLLLGQLGVIGASLWCLAFFTIIQSLPFDSYLKYGIYGQIFVAALSENAFNLLSICAISLMIGMNIAFFNKSRSSVAG